MKRVKLKQTFLKSVAIDYITIGLFIMLINFNNRKKENE